MKADEADAILAQLPVADITPMFKGHIRVFPRRTSHTPTDDWAFVGDPPLFRPGPETVIDVSVSVTFTWDILEGQHLVEAWRQYYPLGRIGGPAFDDPGNTFTPGLYVRQGVTFTSRGCGRGCPWCLVGQREGGLRLLPITDGWIIEDSNFLACPGPHRRAAYTMLARQPHGAVFSGGLDARLVTDDIRAEFRDLRILDVFLAADTDDTLGPLERAVSRLSFLGRERLRCYVLLAYGGETIEQAERRLKAVWEIGAMPHAQLYRPPDRQIVYSPEWRHLARTWSRPAAMKAEMKLPRERG